MKYGLTEIEISFLETTLLESLRRMGAEVYLFGSRARETHQPFSDVDILVKSNADLSMLISNISERLEESNFPYKVDIVEDKNLATNYRSSIDRDKVAIEKN